MEINFTQNSVRGMGCLGCVSLGVGGGGYAVTYPTNILNFLDATFYQGTAYELLVL